MPIAVDFLLPLAGPASFGVLYFCSQSGRGMLGSSRSQGQVNHTNIQSAWVRTWSSNGVHWVAPAHHGLQDLGLQSSEARLRS
jgi:hypothetical protein